MSAPDEVCRLVDGKVQCGPQFCYNIDLNERGDFRADVRNSKDKTVFEINVEAGTESEQDNIFTDGFMKHPEDIDGLERYLKDLGIMPKNASLLTAEQCEQIRIGKEIDAGRKVQRAKLLKMSGQERFDLGYRALLGR